MSVSPRALAVAASVVGVILWIVAVTLDAPLIAIIIPILMLMGGGIALVMITASNEDPAGNESEPGTSDEKTLR